jgi:hypothetical protein
MIDTKTFVVIVVLAAVLTLTATLASAFGRIDIYGTGDDTGYNLTRYACLYKASEGCEAERTRPKTVWEMIQPHSRHGDDSTAFAAQFQDQEEPPSSSVFTPR